MTLQKAGPKFTTISGYASSSIASTECFAAKQSITNLIPFRQGSIGPKTCRTKAKSGVAHSVPNTKAKTRNEAQHSQRGLCREPVFGCSSSTISGMACSCSAVQSSDADCKSTGFMYSGANTLKEGCRKRPVPWSFRHS